MGCAAGKEADEPENQPRQGQEKRNEPAAPAEPVDTRPPLKLHMLSEFWRAGGIKYNAPPHYVQESCGPWVALEKVPPQSHLAGTALIASDRVPPRLPDNTPDGSAADSDGAAESGAAPTEIDLSRDSAGIFLRAYLPHSLSGYCVGWCRPDTPTSALTSSFVYDATTDGAEDLQAVRENKPPRRDVGLRRRLLLFPKAIDAVGVFFTDPSAPSRTFSSSTVAPLNRECSAENTEPMDGALVTFSVVGPATNSSDPEYRIAASPGTRMQRSQAEIGTQVKPVAATYSENSLGITLLPPATTSQDTVALGAPVIPIERRLTDEETPARTGANPRRCNDDVVAAALAERLLAMPDGDHKLDVTVRFRYEQNELAAVYDRPAPHEGAAGIRVCGTYRPNGTETSSSASTTSDPIATGSFKFRLGPKERARLGALRA